MRIVIFLLLGVVLVGCGDGADETSFVLKFSAIPDRNETELRAKYTPVAEYLTEALGVTVEYVHATRYEDAVEQFTNGDIQLAWFGGLTGVKVRHNVDGARAIAQGEEDPNFYSYFIAHKDSGIEPGADFPMAMKGKKFTFGSKLSTSGRLMPEHFIRQHATMAPEEFFGTVNFSGAHDLTIKLVEGGNFDCGAANYKTYDDMVASKKVDPSVCRKIWQTPFYADYNFTAHPRLEEMFGEGFIDRLQAALVDMKDPDLLAAFSRKSLVEASNEDFESIKELARQLDFIR